MNQLTRRLEVEVPSRPLHLSVPPCEGTDPLLAAGEFVENPRHLRRAEAALKRTQRRVSKRKRGSKRRCSGCGCGPSERKTLAVRIHRCAECGLILDRDHNAARNILHLALSEKAGAPPSGSGRAGKVAA